MTAPVTDDLLTPGQISVAQANDDQAALLAHTLAVVAIAEAANLPVNEDSNGGVNDGVIQALLKRVSALEDASGSDGSALAGRVAALEAEVKTLTDASAGSHSAAS